jgi:hypothetical protein
MDVKTSYPIFFEPRQVRFRRVKLEDDRVALPRLQAFRPARLGDGEHLSRCRVRYLGVHRGVSAAHTARCARR